MNFERIASDHPKGVFRHGFCLLIVWLSFAAYGFAQGDASIHGTVSDSSGGAILGATVQVKNLETGAVRDLQTDESGRFDAAALPVGNYLVKVEKPGFRGA
ncbi:MAG: carboxypeptidase regulatory-like domain-containing protein, partial [Acidobacteria bacterium]|nr:carboxypeptidase regulatory-like domain-containing protein [Acidobacteriota bacterium]